MKPGTNDALFAPGKPLAEPLERVLLAVRNGGETRGVIVLAIADDATLRREAAAQVAARLSGAYALHAFTRPAVAARANQASVASAARSSPPPPLRPTPPARCPPAFSPTAWKRWPPTKITRSGTKPRWPC